MVACGKERVEMAYAEMSFGKEDRAGAWVMRWMWREEAAEGDERAMYVVRFADGEKVCRDGS